MFEGFTSIFVWVPQTSLSGQAAIYGSIALEFAIPLLLVFARTRWAGIAGAVIFHMVLAIHPIWATSILTFTMMIFAMLVLFAPDRMLDWFHEQWGRSGRWGIAWVIVAYLITVAAVLATVYPRTIDHPFEKIRLLHTIAFVPHFLSCVMLSAAAVYFCLIRRLSWSTPAVRNWKRSAVVRFNLCWLVLGLTFLNGCCPYAGLKTTTAFTMFSNLRTEGRLDNHLFLAGADWFNYQRHLVRVVGTDDPLLEPYLESGDLITLFELRRICSRDYGNPPNRTYTLSHDVRQHMFVQPRRPESTHFVHYRIDGEDHVACRDRGGGHDLFSPLPWYREKFLAFRPICAPGRPAPCDH